MATDETASIHQLHQPRRAKSAAERAKAYRERQKAAAQPRGGTLPRLPAIPAPVPTSVTSSIPVRSTPTVTFAPVKSSRNHASSYLLAAAALALAIVGMTMNAWFARSLGSTDAAGWLFLAIGAAADVAALALPACAARHWRGRQRATAGVAWLVWAGTFAFAVLAGIGFASVNIADVTMARSGRVTPAITTAQTALADAMGARDRECVHGVGKFCREREQTVTDRRQGLDAAMASVAQTADPQTAAAVHIVTWASRGSLAPSSDDIGMVRLLLLALLPQIGGILLMIGRRQ